MYIHVRNHPQTRKFAFLYFMKLSYWKQIYSSQYERSMCSFFKIPTNQSFPKKGDLMVHWPIPDTKCEDLSRFFVCLTQCRVLMNKCKRNGYNFELKDNSDVANEVWVYMQLENQTKTNPMDPISLSRLWFTFKSRLRKHLSRVLYFLDHLAARSFSPCLGKYVEAKYIKFISARATQPWVKLDVVKTFQSI